MYRTYPLLSPIALKGYLSLLNFHSKTSYCSQLWSPRLMKDIIRLEKVQHCSTKYILCDYIFDYNVRLVNTSPFDVLVPISRPTVFVKCLKEHSDNVKVLNYVTFASSQTRFSTMLVN